MTLNGQELDLFVAACADAENTHAQELLNVFGADRAESVLAQMRLAPLGILVELVSHVWYAMIYEANRRDPEWAEVLERLTA